MDLQTNCLKTIFILMVFIIAQCQKTRYILLKAISKMHLTQPMALLSRENGITHPFYEN